MVTHQIFVENIKCEGCVVNIKEHLQQIKGVTAVEVYKDEQKVCVSGIALEKQELVKKLAALGYPEKGANNFFSKARSLVTCTVDKFS